MLITKTDGTLVYDQQVAAEMMDEDNMNMIDGIPNNTSSVKRDEKNKDAVDDKKEKRNEHIGKITSYKDIKEKANAKKEKRSEHADKVKSHADKTEANKRKHDTEL